MNSMIITSHYPNSIKLPSPTKQCWLTNTVNVDCKNTICSNWLSALVHHETVKECYTTKNVVMIMNSSGVICIQKLQ